jgi:hypothetical protein
MANSHFHFLLCKSTAKIRIAGRPDSLSSSEAPQLTDRLFSKNKTKKSLNHCYGYAIYVQQNKTVEARNREESSVKQSRTGVIFLDLVFFKLHTKI